MPLFAYVVIVALVIGLFVAYNKGKKSVVVPVIPKSKPAPEPPKLGFEEAELILERASESSIEVNPENTALVQLVLSVLGVKNNVKADAQILIDQKNSSAAELEQSAKQTSMDGADKVANLLGRIERLKEEVEQTKEDTLKKVDYLESEVENARERAAEIEKIASLF